MADFLLGLGRPVAFCPLFFPQIAHFIKRKSSRNAISFLYFTGTLLLKRYIYRSFFIQKFSHVR